MKYLSGFQSGSKCYLVFKFKDLMPIVPLPGARRMSAGKLQFGWPSNIYAHTATFSCSKALEVWNSCDQKTVKYGQCEQSHFQVISKSFPSHSKPICVFDKCINCVKAVPLSGHHSCTFGLELGTCWLLVVLGHEARGAIRTIRAIDFNKHQSSVNTMCKHHV